MSTQTYQWERYWYPRDINPPISPEGFLYISPIAFSEARILFRFEEIDTNPCLILLGEPGVGKSRAMLRAYNAIDNTAEVHASLIDLKKFSENELVRELERILDAWSVNGYHLHLFFDSLDEARVRISTVTHIIIRRLEKFSHIVSRL